MHKEVARRIYLHARPLSSFQFSPDLLKSFSGNAARKADEKSRIDIVDTGTVNEVKTALRNTHS